MKLHVAIIDRKTIVFPTVEDKFNALVEEWLRIRGRGSSTAPLINDSYGQIVAMGYDAIPFLLREVEKESGHWFTALEWITAADIVTDDMRGDIRKLREVWLEWGRESGFQF